MSQNKFRNTSYITVGEYLCSSVFIQLYFHWICCMSGLVWIVPYLCEILITFVYFLNVSLSGSRSEAFWLPHSNEVTICFNFIDKYNLKKKNCYWMPSLFWCSFCRDGILLEHLQHLTVLGPHPHFLSLASGNYLQNSLFLSPIATALVGAPLCQNLFTH